MSRYLTPEERRALYDQALLINAGIRFPAVERTDRMTLDEQLEQAEKVLQEFRVRMAQAAMCERGAQYWTDVAKELDCADAYGAVAANKLARAIRIAGNVIAL